MASDPELETHRAWLGPLRPVGLVVSPPALAAAQAFPDRGAAVELQQSLRALCSDADGPQVLADLPAFTREVLGWRPSDLAPPPSTLELALPEYGETLRPDYAVMGGDAPLLLVRNLPSSTAFDEPEDQGWPASPQAKLERLLRERAAPAVPAGLLCNGSELRLVYAPRGETAGHLTFPVAALLEVSGRPLLAALHMLLGEQRLFNAPAGRRLTDIMAASRRYQSEVSTRLAEQVLGALWEMLRGFQAADEATGGTLLGAIPDADLGHVYGGLLTVLLRLVFLLYAEDRGLMPDDPLYAGHYSVAGLHDRLRDDAGRWPDTMDQRYGGWAHLLALFRLVHDGGGHASLRLPARHGQLFDPDEYPFLEGRPRGSHRNGMQAVTRVSDGCIYRVLDALLMLDGERLSYGALDVEQLGSVYEAMMGFAVERAQGLSIGVRSSKKKPGAVPADPVVDVEALLREKPAARKKWLQDATACDLGPKEAAALQAAETPDAAVAALGRKVSRYTPQLIARGALYLQPGEERRRSGSHYTPRELTEPIVRTTLRPVLEALGDRPRPQQILDLKVCDPAMGSGAFLVEACRQLSEKLLDAWTVHHAMPEIPADEEPLLHARRLVAQRCLYGVDKNPFAVNLAKLSLWLVTLARDHAFTFLNHALKCGDSLVGLTREQIEVFHWKEPKRREEPLLEGCQQWVEVASLDRKKLAALEDEREDEKAALLGEADRAVQDLRLVGDLIVAAFFAGSKDAERKAALLRMRASVDEWRHRGLRRDQLEAVVRGLRSGEQPAMPFHWEVEFPEVFGRERPGFDCVVGNPPFLGGKKIGSLFGSHYRDYLIMARDGAIGNADIIAHFFRRAFDLLNDPGCFGLIATNTVGQGDTRSTGLSWICNHGGTIYDATKHFKWPGAAAVVVSVVHVAKGEWASTVRLNSREVRQVTAYLFYAGGHDKPTRLSPNAGKSFHGSVVLGKGFIFEDGEASASTSLAAMHDLQARNPRNRERIFPYIGGEEVNDSPDHRHRRFVIDFGEMSEEEARRWPDLMSIVEAKVKPERMRLEGSYRSQWWLFGRRSVGCRRSCAGLDRVLVNSLVSQHLAFAFLSTGIVFSHKLAVFPLDTYAAFCCLQSRAHEVWSRFFSSTLEDRLNYSHTDCFETYPFCANWHTHPALEANGRTYYEFRADLMVRKDEGLTKTYNRFHDPDERHPDILMLRELHAAMDRAVLDAYGWTDIPTDCDFFLDYEIDEETWGNKKKPWRYRWPDEVHDEVLARLLDLNQKRAEAERLAGLADGKPKNAARRSSRKNVTSDLTLF